LERALNAADPAVHLVRDPLQLPTRKRQAKHDALSD
jgi:hypothetical protein